MHHQTKATECKLREEGLYLTFSDGKSFLYPLAFLFATRFTHAKVVPQDPAGRTASGNPPGPGLAPSLK